VDQQISKGIAWRSFEQMVKRSCPAAWLSFAILALKMVQIFG
jgi:hypothetical protein